MSFSSEFTAVCVLEESIGYHFEDEAYLRIALTHTSYVNENKAKNPLVRSSERLEFLGDSVLGLTVSTYLYETFPESSEGELSEYRQHLVCEATLAHAAMRFSLGDYLLLGQGEQGNRNRSSLLADAMEAVIGAVYLDSHKNGEVTREVILRVLSEEIAYCRNLRGGDYKTRLLQLVQGDGTDILTFESKETGPAHDRMFEAFARLNSNVIGHGFGKKKKEAEQNAAKEALMLFGMIQDN